MVARGWPPRRRSPAEERLFRLKRAFRRVSRAAPRYKFSGPCRARGSRWLRRSLDLGERCPTAHESHHRRRNYPSRILVLDGDTIRIDGRKPDVRLVGLNAPETSRAECKGERDLGEAATRRLQQIVNGSALDLRYVA
jgi:endonuclease YncB( thermonuclease family)